MTSEAVKTFTYAEQQVIIEEEGEASTALRTWGTI